MKLQFSETFKRFLITCLAAGLSLALLPVPHVARAAPAPAPAPRIAAPVTQTADLTVDEQLKLLADTWDLRHAPARAGGQPETAL